MTGDYGTSSVYLHPRGQAISDLGRDGNMSDPNPSEIQSDDRRKTDRRNNSNQSDAGPERRIGNRRAPSAERRTGTRRTERLQMDWQTLGQELPTGDVLVYSGSRIVVANVAELSFDGRSVKSCMDSLANEILEWPTHWMPLPPHPRGRG
jgi:hypothetical protein